MIMMNIFIQVLLCICVAFYLGWIKRKFTGSYRFCQIYLMWVLIQWLESPKREIWTETQEECHVTPEVETGVIYLQDKESQGLEALEVREREGKIILESLWREPGSDDILILDFQLLELWDNKYPLLWII